MASNVCSVCTHPDSEDVDAALVSKTPYRVIAERSGLSITSISRHKNNHMPMDLVSLHLNGADPMTVLSRLERLAARIEVWLEAFNTGKRSPQQFFAASKELRQTLELIAKITGEMRDQPQTVVNIASSNEWREILGTILAALAPYPEQRTIVAQSLKELGAG